MIPDLELIELLYIHGHMDRLDPAIGFPEIDGVPGIINRTRWYPKP